MEQRISDRIALLRLPLITGVVFIHNSTKVPLVVTTSSGTSSLELVDRVIGNGIARVAVPLFYLLSGYLLFLGMDHLRGNYGEKLRRRFWTLLVPFLFWNAASLIVYWGGEHFGGTARFFVSSTRFYAPTAHTWDYINALFGLTTYPIAYQFWFIRDLIVLVLLAPIIHFAFSNRSGVPLLGILSFCWFLGTSPIASQDTEATLFFSVGSYCAFRQIDPTAMDGWGKVLVPMFLLTLASDVICHGSSLGQYAHRLMIVSGVAGCWCTAYWANVNIENVGARLIALSGSSFFVFATHEPLLTICWSLIGKMRMKPGIAVSFAMYFLVPIGLVTVLVLLHHLLKRQFPIFIDLITGERNRGKFVFQESPPIKSLSGNS